MIVYTAADITVGDKIAYPGLVPKHRRDERDVLRVTRLAGETIFATRVHPQEWERDQEFTVTRLQIVNNGVEVADPVLAASSGTDEPTSTANGSDEASSEGNDGDTGSAA